MSKQNYFGHKSEKHGTSFDIMKTKGIKYQTGGENIAKGQLTSTHVMKTWMRSRKHRNNILNPTFTEMGIGRDGHKDNIWTQIFIGN